MSYYAVANGRETGVFINWFECKKNINKYPGARYKKFNTELEALNFIEDYKKIMNNNKNNDIDENVIYIFTDGACNNNGKKNAEAGIGIYFSENDNRNVSEKIDGKQTNNTAELKAVIKAIYIIISCNISSEICICTDSEYVIKCATTYGEKIEIKERKKPPPNLELIKELYNLCKNNNNIHFKYIKAHTDNDDFYSNGNKQADLLANMSIGLKDCPYNMNNNMKKIYLNVKYENKDEAKSLGAKWCPKNKKWYYIETTISEDNINELKIKFT